MLSCVCFGEDLTPNIQVAMRWCSALPALSGTTAFVWAFLSKRPRIPLKWIVAGRCPTHIGATTCECTVESLFFEPPDNSNP